MKYDFDMISVTPKDFQTKYAIILGFFGMTEQASEKIAVFRDPHASWALAGASEPIRDCFVASGFALNCRQTNARAGHYAASDADSREQVIARLIENLENLPEDLDWNGFDIDAFFAEARAASPETQTASAYAGAGKLIMPPVSLMPSDRVRSRALSTPAPGF